MIAFLQRVSHAQVVVDGHTVGAIGAGLMVLLCAEREDGLQEVGPLLRKLVNYRVFPDHGGKMNLSLLQVAAQCTGADPDTRPGLLLVPQFTLAADTRSGNRPSFTPAAPPELGRQLFDAFVSQARDEHGAALRVETGRFGADMKVSLTNDGPVSFWLQSRKSAHVQDAP